MENGEMVLGVMVAVAGAAAAVAVAMSLVLKRKRGGLPPGPRPLPVMGNLHQLGGRQALHRKLAALAAQYGPIFYLRLGFLPTAVISSPALAKEVLLTQDKILANRPQFEAAQRMGYGPDNSISMASLGPTWQYLRRFATLHLFTPKRIAGFRPIRDQEIALTLARIQSQADTPLDLTAHIGALLEAVVFRMAVGRRQADVANIERLKGLVRRTTVLFQVPIIGELIPMLAFLDRNTKAALDGLHAEWDTLLEELIHTRLHSHEDSCDFLSVLLSGFSDLNRVKNLLQEFIIGALDSSSATLDWAMSELIANPSKLQRLQEELDDLVGRDKLVEEEDLDKLSYLKAVVKEAFRMHPPTPLLLPHMSSEPCLVGGYNLPKDCQILINVWAIGRDSLVWDMPEKFMPERFLSKHGANLDMRGQHFEFLPFGAGRRMCPGLSLGLIMVEVSLARFVHMFSWVAPPQQPTIDFSETFGVVVSRTNHLFAIPSPRLCIPP